MRGCNEEVVSAYQRTANFYKDKLNSLGEASKCLSYTIAYLKKINLTEAIGCYQSAVTLVRATLGGSTKLSISPNKLQIFLEKWSCRQGGWRGDAVSAAIASYQQAAELFKMEQAKSQASSCLQKVAELRSGAMDPPEFLRAADIHKSLGR